MSGKNAAKATMAAIGIATTMANPSQSVDALADQASTVQQQQAEQAQATSETMTDAKNSEAGSVEQHPPSE